MSDGTYESMCRAVFIGSRVDVNCLNCLVGRTDLPPVAGGSPVEHVLLCTFMVQTSFKFILANKKFSINKYVKCIWWMPWR